MIAGAGECKVEKASLLFGSTLELLSKINSISTKSVLQQPTESYWILANASFWKDLGLFLFQLIKCEELLAFLVLLGSKDNTFRFLKKTKNPPQKNKHDRFINTSSLQPPVHSYRSNGFIYLLKKNWAYLLQQVSLLDGLQHIFLGCFLGLSAQQELIQDEVSLLKVEDDIQLAHLRVHKTTNSSRSEETLSLLKILAVTF